MTQLKSTSSIKNFKKILKHENGALQLRGNILQLSSQQINNVPNHLFS